jgi:hypothetical protein
VMGAEFCMFLAKIRSLVVTAWPKHITAIANKAPAKRTK